MGAFAFGWLFLQELFERFGLLAALVAVLAGLSIFAHVAGAFVGSRYRKIGIETPNPEISEDEAQPRPMAAKQSDFAPVTELSQQQPLSKTPIYWAIGIGASVCAILASIILTWFMWNNLAIANVLFGSISAAVIGGLLGFWISSFFQVVRSALADAQKNS